MQQQSANQKAKPGRKPRPAVQLTRIRKETIETVDRLCAALNTLRGPRDAQAMRPQVIAEIVAQYSGAYLADRAQDAARRAQAALGAAQDATPASAAPAAPQAPQEPAQAALPLAQSTAPRCVAPHYFAMHGEVR